jgi:activator of HSP90 ATPase
MGKSFEISLTLPVLPEVIYKAWLDSHEHSQMTESPAEIDGSINGRFTAWDGYISGFNVNLTPHERIVQSWRTTDFLEGVPDSRIEITLTKINVGTRLLLKHSNIPEGKEAEYKQGWKDFYFSPMKKYFKAKKSG